MAKPGEYIEIVKGKITHHVKKDYNLYSGGNLTINAGKSVILNAEGGITFGDYEEPPAPKGPQKKGGNEKPIYQLEWINEAGEKTKGLLYGEKAAVLVTLTKSIKGKTLEFLFKEKSNGKELKRLSYFVKDDSLTQKCSVNFTMEDFVNCEKHQGQYVFEVTLEGEVYVNSSEILRVFPVIYIPEIMKSKGWTYSFKSQEDWFHGDPIEFPWENRPKTNDFLMGWALKFKRVKEAFDEVREVWKNETALNELRRLIKTEMVVEWPVEIGTKSTFGTFNDKTIDQVWRKHDDAKLDHPGVRVVKEQRQALEYVPAFEKYHFQSRKIEESYWTEVDDFYGAIANCTIKFVAKGTLEKKKEGIEVNITDLGIYIRDGFDYVGRNILGYWSFKSKAVSKNFMKGLTGDFIGITNASYREYRETLEKGGDFYRYSDLHIDHPNYKFLL
jgi:hypothetical protein